MTQNGMKMMESAPVPQMVGSLARSLAEAQDDLNISAVEAMRRMSDPAEGVVLPGETQKRSLIELGLEPTFLHIAEATINIRVAFTCVESQSQTMGASVGVYYGLVGASINAGYTSKYSFESQGASEIRTRIVSVPVPPELNRRLRAAADKKNSEAQDGTSPG